MSAAQVAGVTGLSSATAHRILKTLQSQSYLEQDPQTRAYSLGVGVLQLASNIADAHDEVKLLARMMTQIRDATCETINLHRRVGDRRVCIAEEVSRQPVRVTSGVGKSYPLNAGAASKAIMSLLPDEEIERILDLGDTGSDARPLSRQGFLRAIAQTRERGYASSRGETVPGAAAVAIPVRRADPLSPGAVNLTGPKNRWTPQLVEEALPMMRDAARQIMEVNAHFGSRT
jgi:DNA-binding IclR family transcriptional regulator